MVESKYYKYEILYDWNDLENMSVKEYKKLTEIDNDMAGYLLADSREWDNVFYIKQTIKKGFEKDAYRIDCYTMLGQGNREGILEFGGRNSLWLKEVEKALKEDFYGRKKIKFLEKVSGE